MRLHPAAASTCLSLLIHPAWGFTATTSVHRPSTALFSAEGGVAEAKMTTLEKEALSAFFSPEQLDRAELTPATGGVSNSMSFVDFPSSPDASASEEKQRYLLRIYNNGQNSKKVKFEHEIMRQLSAMKDRLSFETPTALPSLVDADSTTYKLSSGDESCVFAVIPGTLPKLSAAEEIGRASGELHTAMSKVNVDRALSVEPPYHDLYAVHHATTKDNFYETVSSDKFGVPGERDDVDELVRHVRDLEHRLDEFRAKGLPEQLIHGDLHYDNVLIDASTNEVTGLLDFEYCAFDWRAMELAVCLSKYASEENALEYMRQFAKGFAKTATLTEDEIDSIPDLMVLRIISNVVFFVGRVISGEDEPDQLVTRAGMYNSRIGWLLDNRAVLCQMIAAEMGKVML